MKVGSTNGPVFILGEAALDASGAGWVKAIWDGFFPPDEPVFSYAQMQQLENLFQRIFSENNYQQNLSDFDSYTQLTAEYVSQPSQQMLTQLLVGTLEVANRIFANGYISSKVYLSCAALHILALRFSYDSAPENERHGAAKNISDATVSVLNNLAILEGQFFSACCTPSQTLSVKQFIDFKNYTLFGVGEMPQSAIESFGGGYRNRILDMLNLVLKFGPDDMNKIKFPQFLLKYVPYDSSLCNFFWNSMDCSKGWNPAGCMFGEMSLLGQSWYPVGDVAIVGGGENEPPASPPDYLVFISRSVGTTSLATSSNFIYDDHGSGNSSNYSGWTVISDEGVGIGTYNGIYNWGGSDYPPPNNARTPIIPNDLLIQVTLGDQMWNDEQTGAGEDCCWYSHPQFGEFGVYCLFRSHSGPSSNSVYGIDPSAFTGFPMLQLIVPK